MFLKLFQKLIIAPNNIDLLGDSPTSIRCVIIESSWVTLPHFFAWEHAVIPSEKVYLKDKVLWNLYLFKERNLKVLLLQQFIFRLFLLFLLKRDEMRFDVILNCKTAVNEWLSGITYLPEDLFINNNYVYLSNSLKLDSISRRFGFSKLLNGTKFLADEVFFFASLNSQSTRYSLIGRFLDWLSLEQENLPDRY